MKNIDKSKQTVFWIEVKCSDKKVLEEVTEFIGKQLRKQKKGVYVRDETSCFEIKMDRLGYKSERAYSYFPKKKGSDE